uniref:Uncharacterized protein n=1 Tax=uncultured virus TaxID=340016 RepID=D5L2B4_9VIRU|nr:hypothetical protein [uncultured virus]
MGSELNNIEKIGGQVQSAVDVADAIDQIQDALQSAGGDELRVRTFNSSGDAQDLQQTASAYENATNVNADAEVANLLVAPGGSNITGRVVSSGQYDVIVRYQDDQGNTIFTETVATGVAGGTQTRLGPNNTTVEPESDHVEIAISDTSSAQQTVNAVLHFN